VTRILWLGDLGGTGFGTVTQDLCHALVDRGEDVRVFAFRDTLPSIVPEWAEGRIVSLERAGQWLTWDETISAGERMRLAFAKLFTAEGYDDGWAPDCVIVLGDPAAIIRSELLGVLPPGLPAYHYVPIEGIGLPPSWRTIWQRIKPIAMSKAGAAEIGRLMLTSDIPVVYHGVNTDDFYPATPSHPITWPGEEKIITSRSDAKAAFGIDRKTTVLLRTDANMPRKSYGALFRSLAPVLAAHRDLMLIVHARRIGEGGNLDEFRSHFPPEISGKIAVPDFHDKYGGLPRYALATLYNAADIYVSNSCEGFGLTIAEAIACGVPAVGLDFSAVPEVIGPAGVVVRPGRFVENIYAHWWAVADEEAFGIAVNDLIRNKPARWKYAGQGPEHIRSSFTWGQAAAQLSEIVGVREAVAA
jgi:glycosyltransferase involved in cell wall biosynthesis